MKRYLILIFFITGGLHCLAQVEVGKWREHLPYRMGIQLQRVDQTLFCLTHSGLFSYSLNDNRVQTHSKASGLSDVLIQSIAAAVDGKSLIIGYDNGNVDVLGKEGVVNIPHIQREDMVQDKAIYSILPIAQKVLLGTGFGIVVLNLDKAEVADTYYIGEGGSYLRVNSLVQWNGYYWAATTKGIFRASVNSSNLSDFNRWEQLSLPEDPSREVMHLVVWSNGLVCSRSLSGDQSQLVRFSNGSWDVIIPALSRISSLRCLDNQLWVFSGGILRILDDTGREMQRIAKLDGKIADFQDGLVIEGNRRFFAHKGRGMIEITPQATSVDIRPEGPQGTAVSNLLSTNHGTWLVPGGVTQQQEGLSIEGRVERFNQERWELFTPGNGNKWTDLYMLTSDKLDNHFVYAASWGHGIVSVSSNGDQKQWDASNSILGSDIVRIGGLDTDLSGNLWVLDAGTREVVKRKDPQGEWTSLYYPQLASRTDMRKLIALSNGDKWVMMGKGRSLFAFNDNSTPSNVDDDVKAGFQVQDENGRTLTSGINTIVEDREGKVWIGSDNGVMVYSQPGNILRNQTFYAHRPIIDIAGDTQYLLGTQKVNCIAVDGANNKWFGTASSGVFLVNDAGTEQLLHFNVHNSPLLSNNVSTISVDPQSGEVFLGTDKGVISYRHSVTSGTPSFSGAYAFPNPVREDYHGDVIVTGLMENSSVKITDVAGNLVFEGRSQGGQFVWDIRNFLGNRVHTGVYIVLCASNDGAKAKAIKLLVIH